MDKSVHKDVVLIIMNLKILGYKFDTENVNYVKDILTTPSSTRNALLFWVLKIWGLLSSYGTQEQKAFNSAVVKKIASDLSAVGLCKPQDVGVIDGSASPHAQLTFWKTFVRLSTKLKNTSLSHHSNSASDDLLNSLVNSPYYGESMKSDDLHLLSKDIRSALRASLNRKEEEEEGKGGSTLGEVPWSENEKTNHMLDASKHEHSDDKPTENCEDETDSAIKTLVDSISSLRSQNDSFVAMQSVSFRPWCEKDDSHQLTSSSESRDSSVSSTSATGEFVKRCSDGVRLLRKHVDLFSSVECSNQEIGSSVERLKEGGCVDQSRVASVVLDSIVKAMGQKEI